MLAASQGQCSTHGFNQIHTLGKDIEGETETERNAERERAKEKKRRDCQTEKGQHKS